MSGSTLTVALNHFHYACHDHASGFFTTAVFGADTPLFGTIDAFGAAEATDESKRQTHAICVALFLVFGHIAMIAGMLDPALLGYVPEGMSEMHNH